MTTLTESRHAGEFILSEANGSRSRANGTLAMGEDLAAGTVLMSSGGNLVEYDAGTGSDAVGILIYPTDATDAAVAVSYIARDAEVNANLIAYPAGQLSATTTSLAALGIIVRS